MKGSPKSKERFSSADLCKILVDGGLLSKEQAKHVLSREKAVREALVKKRKDRYARPDDFMFVDVLSHLKVRRLDDPSKRLDEDAVFECFAKAWRIPYRKIDPLKLELNLVTRTIPRIFAMKHLLLPVDIEENTLVVATPDPFNEEAISDVERACGLKVQPVVSSRSDIVKILNEFFGFRHSITAAEDHFSGQGVDLGNLEQYVRLKSDDELPATDQHIVNAVNHLFSYAFDQQASDIHIEPKRDASIIRMRIDGILHTVYRLPKKVHNAVASRVKTLSRLDMAEKRRPQDGRIKMEKADKEVEIRVSTIPVAFGEKLVMRIMDPDVLLQDIESLGLEGPDYERYNRIIKKPFGIVLVTGPTGSGKSTTLYSSLRSLSSPSVNITTVEDPIEMIHEDFNQIAVQSAIGVTFASVLRNILRQDPDIIMVGEIRDLETAQSAVQASLTGHLVLSTLHTNDAVSAIVRLVDLGVPPYLIHSSLAGVAAQRLVRKICPFCTEDFQMERSELRDLGFDLEGDEPVPLKYGKGCIKCRNTGYKGRTAIFEVLPYTESLKKMTAENMDVDNLRRRACAEGLTLLRENGIRKMLNGETTYHEVLRVTWEE